MTTATLMPIKQENLTGEFIHELKVKSGDHLRVFLGRFDVSQKINGFVIEVSPSTVAEESVATRISRLDSEINTKFFLDIVNKNTRSIRARVRLIN